MSQLLDRISNNCTKYPDRIAFQDDNRALTYRELWEESGRVTSWLKANGYGKEDICLIVLPRSVSSMASMLGVLRAGCAFCNIDSSYPPERIAFIRSELNQKCEIDEETYKIMQENQKLTVNFKEFCNLLKRLFNNCINEPQSYISVFIMQKEGTGRLDFIQNIEYKFIELLSIDFVNSPDDTVRKQIGYRYNALRTKMEMMQERIIAINNIIKIKNPSLLHQINKTPSKFNMNKSNYSSVIK
jgi:hypothetical protein